MDCILTGFGSLDILVNNAGTIRRAPALEYTYRDWDETLQTNLSSVFRLSQLAARDMLPRGEGESSILRRSCRSRVEFSLLLTRPQKEVQLNSQKRWRTNGPRAV